MKRSTLFKTTILTAAMLAFGTAFADDDTGWYLGIGVAALDSDFDDVDDLTFEDSDTTAQLKGGYMFNDMFGIEGGWVDLGDYKGGSGIEVDANAFWLTGVGNWSFANNWDLYGKVGMVAVNAKSDQVIPFRGQVKEDDTETDIFGAVGLEYDFGSWNLFGEYAVMDTDVSDLNVSMVTLGVKWDFGK